MPRTYIREQDVTLTVNHGEQCVTPDALLDLVLSAYERGRQDALADAGRSHWMSDEVVTAFREDRVRAETAVMRERAQARYIGRLMPESFDYKGGAVDWETGFPAGSGCAWLRRQRMASRYGLAGGEA